MAKKASAQKLLDKAQKHIWAATSVRGSRRTKSLTAARSALRDAAQACRYMRGLTKTVCKHEVAMARKNVARIAKQ